jgi:hypothetical protein
MRRQLPITESEVPTVFSDEVVARLAVAAKLPFIIDLHRFADGVRASVVVYAVGARTPTPNSVHREIAALHRAAAGRDYERAARLLAELSAVARQIIEDRARRISLGLVVDGAPPDYTLPIPEQLRDSEQRDLASQMIQTLVVLGGHVKETAAGKLTREWTVTLCGPKASRAEPRRRAERHFVAHLQANYLGATGQMPPVTAHHDVPGPFARFVAACLHLVRAPVSDLDHDCLGLAVQLVNDIERQRKLERATRSLRRLLEPLCQFQPVSIVGRLIERGKANVRRIPSGSVEIEREGRAALFEFGDSESLCFAASAKLRRTIRLRPRPRARIMRLALMLQKADRNDGRLRRASA